MINLTSIFGTDFAGVFLLLIIILTKGWSLPARKKESHILLCLTIATVFYCAGDAFVSLCDGRPGQLIRVICIIGNTYLYIYNLLVGLGIIYLVVNHIDQTIPRLQILFFVTISAVEVVLLTMNFFRPIVFHIDSSNVYHRDSFYPIFLLAGALLIIYGYSYYFISKIKSPALRYFPVWQFLTPIVIAMIIQGLVYGVSLQPIGYAIAFAGLVICLQNECIYIDKLTGVYNRYELDNFRKALSRLRREKVAALMLDLNGFKAINDNYSHAEGDAALCAFADILVKVIRNEGIVIRFAGDEFIVIIRRFKDENIDRVRKKILDAVEEYNETSGKPYKLSAAVGGEIFSHTGEQEDVVAKIDYLMYKDKQDYYKTHPQADRRR